MSFKLFSSLHSSDFSLFERPTSLLGYRFGNAMRENTVALRRPVARRVKESSLPVKTVECTGENSFTCSANLFPVGDCVWVQRALHHALTSHTSQKQGAISTEACPWRCVRQRRANSAVNCGLFCLWLPVSAVTAWAGVSVWFCMCLHAAAGFCSSCLTTIRLQALICLCFFHSFFRSSDLWPLCLLILFRVTSISRL